MSMSMWRRCRRWHRKDVRIRGFRSDGEFKFFRAQQSLRMRCDPKGPLCPEARRPIQQARIRAIPRSVHVQVCDRGKMMWLIAISNPYHNHSITLPISLLSQFRRRSTGRISTRARAPSYCPFPPSSRGDLSSFTDSPVIA